MKVAAVNAATDTFCAENALSGWRIAKRKNRHEAGFSLCGAPGEIRTPDHQVRSLVLYPAELRAHWKR
jgi:hypothetical protein